MRPNIQKTTMVALALAAFAVPATAQAENGEGRVEARGGIAWASGGEEAVAGIAAGYDFDLGDSAFAGVEASADKVLVNGANVVLGATGRLGLKVGEEGKLFVAAGGSFNVDFFGEVFHAGAGYQHKLGKNVYGKVEYRRYFEVIDVNTATAGVGITF